MREGAKKNIQEKKPLNLFLEKLMRVKNKKNIRQISGKANEGDKMKKIFDLFEKKLLKATEKNNKKKHSWKNVFLSPKINFFFSNVFFIF